MERRGRIVVAMSGGVDSAVAAARLHDAGHEVVGVTLHLWDYPDEGEGGGGGSHGRRWGPRVISGTIRTKAKAEEGRAMAAAARPRINTTRGARPMHSASRITPSTG